MSKLIKKTCGSSDIEIKNQKSKMKKEKST